MHLHFFLGPLRREGAEPYFVYMNFAKFGAIGIVIEICPIFLGFFYRCILVLFAYVWTDVFKARA